jgi:hypothetical protein
MISMGTNMGFIRLGVSVDIVLICLIVSSLRATLSCLFFFFLLYNMTERTGLLTDTYQYCLQYNDEA